MADGKFTPFEFDSQECAAVAHDLAILQMPAADRDELNFSVNDLEIIIRVAKGEFDCTNF
jgi:hypothetical protein